MFHKSTSETMIHTKNKNMKTNFLLIAFLLFSFKGFNQTTITLQPGSAGFDAHVDNNTPNSMDVNYPVINAGYNTVGGNPTISHNFMGFDLSAIPAGSTIVSATLSLWHSTSINHSNSSANEELFAKVTQNWDESSVTWNTQPTFSSTDTIHIGTTNVGDDKLNINLQSFVQDWVTTPATNFGMVMHLVDEPGALGRFQSYASSDVADSTRRPKLVITFNPPCTTETLTLQPGIKDGIDVHVDDLNPNLTDNLTTICNAGYNTVGGTPTLSHNYLQFDLTSIPAGSTVVSAKLSLTHSSTVPHSTSSDNAELLAKVTQLWYENTVTWNNQPTYSTTDTVQIGTTNVGDDKPNINLLSFVQDWVNNPLNNFGMVMHLVDEPGSLGRFQSYASSDNPDSSARPKLVVEWLSCTSTGVNEISASNFSVNVYPNPATDELHLTTADGGTVNAIVYDMLGNKISESKNVNVVYVKSLSSGLYLVNVSENGVSKILRFIKQ